ncbi:MAG: sigma-70 family RNA polymerase sigma factor [Sphingobacteriaceae bacterium]
MHIHYKKLVNYAYGILGSQDDAKDAVQDVMERYISMDKQHIENETSYLIKASINQAINIKNRKKKLVGNNIWLPEPVATEFADVNITKNETVSYSMMVLLENLNAKERAVFILKEAFDYSHEEIAATLSLTIENSRKLLSRAKDKLRSKGSDKVQTKKSFSAPMDYMSKYISAIKNGNISTLENLLSEDITVTADGGRNINVVSQFTVGKEPAVNLLLYVYNTYQQSLSISVRTFNNQPALLFHQGDALINCQIFELTNDNKISRIYSIVDPEKLKKIF